MSAEDIKNFKKEKTILSKFTPMPTKGEKFPKNLGMTAEEIKNYSKSSTILDTS